MKKTLAIALACASVVSTALAQQTVEPSKMPIPGRSTVSEPKMPSSTVAGESEFRWYSRIMPRRDERGQDTNRTDLSVPLGLGNPVTVEMRGFGQIFPAPATLFQIYNGSIFNTNTTRIYDNLDTSFGTDQDYINQFLNAQSYTIDSLRMPFYKNPYSGATQNPGLVTIFKTKYNFRSNTYKTQGFLSGRQALTKVREIELPNDQLDNTIVVDGNDTLVAFTLFTFTGDPGSGEEPISFAADESAIVLFTNEFAPVVEQPVAQYDTREFQRMISEEAYRDGDVHEDPDNPGTFLDTRARPLDSTKCFGVVMFRAAGTLNDSVYSSWRGLVFTSSRGERRALINTNIIFYGTVLLSGGVRYHFGSDANEQGIGAVVPNPVRAKATIPFMLNHVGNVRMDLFDAGGTFIKTIVDDRYVAGHYSVDLTTDGMANGVYLVRMNTGDNVYTSKISVSR